MKKYRAIYAICGIFALLIYGIISKLFFNKVLSWFGGISMSIYGLLFYIILVNYKKYQFCVGLF